MIEKVGPTIHKPGAYNTPGIYKGAAGVYNGLGVYNDGSIIPGPVPVDHLILCEYFNKRVGVNLSSGTINNFGFDSQCPLNIPGGAPYSQNTDYTNLRYNDLEQIILTKTFTIEFFLKVNSLASSVNSSPTAIMKNTGDYWLVGICPMSNDANGIVVWFNDTKANYYITDITQWHHYEVSVNNGIANYFVDGIKKSTRDISNNINNDTFFVIETIRSNRCSYKIAQVAIWDICKHTENFNVDFEPIAY